MGFVNHRITGLLAQQQLQCFALQRHSLQVEVRVGRPQIVRYGTGHAHRYPVFIAEFFQVDRHHPVAHANHQVRHSHVRVGIQPDAQPRRGLRQARCEVDLASPQSALQRRLVREVAPGQLELQQAGQPVHQLHVDARQLLQATIVLGKRRLQHQADTQAAVLVEPLALGSIELHRRHRGHRGCQRDQGKA
ncbi:hypothetical protein D3C75_950230 [compost metagenome]